MKTLLLASRAKDNIYKNNKLIRVESAGPCFYIASELNRLGHAFVEAECLPAEVNVYIKGNDESGEIIKPESIFVSSNLHDYECLIISTISPNAIDLTKIASYQGIGFVDIQGFLRGNIDVVTKIITNLVGLKSVLYIKGNFKEIEILRKLMGKDAFSSKIIIETLGKDGVNIYKADIKNHISATRFLSTTDSIGAGDTFFADFVHFVTSQKFSVEDAITRAIDETCMFLECKV